MRKVLNIFLAALALLLTACRGVEPIVPPTDTDTDEGYANGSVLGFYLLNEGNMGSNKCTLDWYDAVSGVYSKNIYASRNPGVAMELGDVGNDIAIYGGKLYAVINCSHFVEVMDAATAKHIGTVSVPNCRNLAFKDGFAYVTSYAGKVEMDPNSRRGYVAKIDTLTLSIVDSCTVGYQPNEMAIVGDKMYVCNSGGYRAPNYDNTLSVIDLKGFTEVKKIEVGINLQRIEKDRNGLLYVSSGGNRVDIPSKTFIVDSSTDKVVETIDLLPCSEMTLCGDSLYVISTEWSNATSSNVVSYALYDIAKRRVVSRNFITDGTEKQIAVPYGIAVNGETGDIYVTDAGDYVTPGVLYCFSREGKLKWKVVTGDIPAHFAFRYRKK